MPRCSTFSPPCIDILFALPTIGDPSRGGGTMRPLRSLCIALALCALPAAAQKPKDMTPDLQKAREALEKYKDPVAAIHDGYFSTLGCVTYPKPGTPGQVPYPKGGMGVHFFNVQ